MNMPLYGSGGAFVARPARTGAHHSPLRSPGGLAWRRIMSSAPCLALGIILCNAPGGAAAADLRVTVQTPTGQPASGAYVCAGVPQNPSQYATATTSASGVAILRNLPSGPVQVTALAVGNGRAVVHQVGAGSEESVVIRLPIPPTPQTCGASPSSSPPLVSNPRLGPSEPVVQSPLHPQVDASKLPTEKLQPLAPGRISPKVEYCFGALGAQCGLPQATLPTTALCAAGQCQINAGSWEHDECCFANPGGMACTAGPLDYITGHNGRCVKEWNKALAHLSAGLNWTRRIDFNRGNNTGRVNFSEYCAPTGTRVHSDDVRYCCSRQADAVPPPPGVTQVMSPLRRCK